MPRDILWAIPLSQVFHIYVLERMCLARAVMAPRI